MKTFIASMALVLMLPSASYAQALPIDGLTPPFPSERAQTIANAVSWGTVGAAMALDFADAWRSHPNDRAHAVQLFAVRAFVNVVAATTVKGLTDRLRPDGSDRQSHYSQHAAHAFSTMGGARLSFVLPLAVTSGGLRIGAKKHYLTDVLAGAAVGALTSRIR